MTDSKDQHSEAAKREEDVLRFWNENDIFRKTLEKDSPQGTFAFYDGPPFANGLPHYGHIIASVIKDAVPRYWTMKGYHVPRRWGWDCHGLPVENEVEKQLGLKSKKDIERIGVAEFNKKCRESVLTYADEWKKIIPRIGRWADMDHPYHTMDRDFMESVWWVFKELYDKELIYEDYRTMHICPRCETTLSQQEVAEGYAMIKDISVTAKFKVKDPEQHGLPEETFILAWTTTPWTLPGNVALAVGSTVGYVLVQHEAAHIVVARERREALGLTDAPVIKDLQPEDLVGLGYEPLFDYYASDNDLPNHENGWKVYAADFVTTEEGTGIVHIASAFGEEDMTLSKEKELPFVQHVSMDGTFKAEVRDFAGRSVKPKENHPETDIEIIKYLAHNDLLFSKEKIEHNYPLCWRCDTPLLNYATSSWFVAVTKVKDQLLENAKSVHWSPEHIKEGRFGKWLEGARDWSISRQRFWASVMPLWRCVSCGKERVFGSVQELEEASGQTVADLHKDVVDEITIPCECGEDMRRIPDVLDTWFDSGSMPYAQAHYPFSDKEQFEKTFPANFIAEGIDQTRAWFYYLHVLGGALRNSPAFQNVIVNGVVLAEDGKKMSKKLKNYPDPKQVVEKYGADALRLYLLSSPIVRAENLNFSESGVDEVAKKTIGRLVNVVLFYALYEQNAPQKVGEGIHVLDRWVIARLDQLNKEVTDAMDAYELDRATRPLADFVDDLSTWYVRRSRDRIKDGGADGQAALGVLAHVLGEFAKIAAPFMPFTAEWVWRSLKSSEKESVHLADWPEVRSADAALLEEMEKARHVVSLTLEQRAKANIKVRQPLAALTINTELGEDVLSIVADEVNVKVVHIDTAQAESILLDTTITPELKEEGLARELIRIIQSKRRDAGFTIADSAVVSVRGDSTWERVVTDHNEIIRKAVQAETLTYSAGEEFEVVMEKAKGR